MRRLKQWSGRLHWGQLIMVLLGCATVFCVVGFLGSLGAMTAAEARQHLRDGDFEENTVRIGESRFYWTVDRLDDRRMEVVANLDYYKAVADSLRFAGVSWYDIERQITGSLPLKVSYSQAKADYERQAGIVFTGLSYLALLASVTSVVFFFAVLWWWFGARRPTIDT